MGDGHNISKIRLQRKLISNGKNCGLRKFTVYSSLTGTENPTHAAHTAVDSWQGASLSRDGADVQATLATWCIWSAPHQILSPTLCPAKEVRISLLKNTAKEVRISLLKNICYVLRLTTVKVFLKLRYMNVKKFVFPGSNNTPKGWGRESKDLLP
jgi:hypothetical protein